MSRGTVKRFGAKNGYGFIEDDKTGEILFFHKSNWGLRLPPVAGLIVEYVPLKTEKGMRATEITRARKE